MCYRLRRCEAFLFRGLRNFTHQHEVEQILIATVALISQKKHRRSLEIYLEHELILLFLSVSIKNHTNKSHHAFLKVEVILPLLLLRLNKTASL